MDLTSANLAVDRFDAGAFGGSSQVQEEQYQRSSCSWHSGMLVFRNICQFGRARGEELPTSFAAWPMVLGWCMAHLAEISPCQSENGEDWPRAVSHACGAFGPLLLSDSPSWSNASRAYKGFWGDTSIYKLSTIPVNPTAQSAPEGILLLLLPLPVRPTGRASCRACTSAATSTLKTWWVPTRVRSSRKRSGHVT